MNTWVNFPNGQDDKMFTAEKNASYVLLVRIVNNAWIVQMQSMTLFSIKFMDKVTKSIIDCSQ